MQAEDQSSNELNDLLRLTPNIQRIYCSLQRLAEPPSRYWLGAAEFRSFLLGEHASKWGVSGKLFREALSTQLIEDIDFCFRSLQKKISRLVKSYSNASKRANTVLSPNMTIYNVRQELALINQDWVTFRKKVAADAARFVQEYSSNSELDILIDRYSNWFSQAWKDYFEFEKFRQDTWRLRIAALGVISAVAFSSIGLFISVIALLSNAG